jgi:antibiotic biosynthesis monooxygenase (ABM) superfamily enzyme
MAIEVLIRRKVMAGKAKELSPLIVKLRSLATIQPGYISGETLICIDPPGRNEYLVRSTWHSVENWKKWLHSKERAFLDDQIEQLSREKAEYAIYESLVSGIIPTSSIQREK